MNVFQAIEQRRAIKSYQDAFVIPEEDVEKIVHAGMLAPTSFNIQHWRFVRIRDAQLREELRQAAMNQPQVVAGSELFVITGDVNAWQTSPERYWSHTDAETQTMIVEMLTDFYSGNPELQRDEALRSGSMAAQNMMLTAKALGYDSCPMIGFDPVRVSELIRLPKNFVIVMLLVIGKPETPPRVRGGQLPIGEVLLDDHF